MGRTIPCARPAPVTTRTVPRVVCRAADRPPPSPSSRSAAVATRWTPTNSRAFSREGVNIVDEPAADVVLVNTCTFIAPAKQESIDTVLAACDLKDRVRGGVVVGCMAERYPQELAESIPEADAVVGFAAYPRLPDLVGDILAGRPHDRVIGADPRRPRRVARACPSWRPGAAAVALGRAGAPWLAAVPERPANATPRADAQDDLDRVPDTGPRFPVRRFDGGPWAYLKIASGCDRACTFCAIPSFRGRFRSRAFDEILAEAAWLAQQGARELVLVSENTTSWGKDLDGRGSCRSASLQPRLLEELAGGRDRTAAADVPAAGRAAAGVAGSDRRMPEVAPYFDLSLQHVSATVLQRMARSGSPERFGALLRRIRSLDPNAAFRSNFILGFPGETEDDVGQLEDFLQEQRLDWVGLFTFSEEDGTPSATMADQVDQDEAGPATNAPGRCRNAPTTARAATSVGRWTCSSKRGRAEGGWWPRSDAPTGKPRTRTARSAWSMPTGLPGGTRRPPASCQGRRRGGCRPRGRGERPVTDEPVPHDGAATRRRALLPDTGEIDRMPSALRESEPHWLNVPNGLTFLRALLVPVILVLLAQDDPASRWWAFGIFVFAAATDSIDGWVARRWHGVTRWGQLADPIADKLLILDHWRRWPPRGTCRGGRSTSSSSAKWP